MRFLNHSLRFFVLALLVLCTGDTARASKLFIPMDAHMQADHLKAYGIIYAALQQGIEVQWLLNYRGGSFTVEDNDKIEALCAARGVSHKSLSNKEYAAIEKEMKKGGDTYNIVSLEKAPRIAVYTPSDKKPWDDAVTLALTYAQIPFDKLYADQVLGDSLDNYDWLHLHHEDFTGQMGKYWAMYHDAPWYIQDQQGMQAMAARHGFSKISQLQLAVVKKIRDFVGRGGNLFAMCSATETFDIALAAEHTDICDEVFDGDPIDGDYQEKLDYTNCFAFRDFRVTVDPSLYEHSNIDNFVARSVPEYADSFVLEVFPAKPDPVPAMLTQNHTTLLKGFMGQTTVFRRQKIKPGVLILAGYPPPPANTSSRGFSIYNMHDNEARYLHGDYKKGTWTFYSGHDPEDFQHMVNDPPTDLSLHPNSPGYRLILNNVLLPSVKRVEVPKIACCDVPVVKPATEKRQVTAPAISAPDAYNIYPSGDKLTVSVAHNKDAAVKSNSTLERVVITNAAGKEFINQMCSGESVSIDVKDLPQGMYLVTVNGSLAGKLMKE